jgi:hypothetical protein
MRIKKIPYWLLSGLMIFPILFVLGGILYLVSFGKINFLFWMIIPSIIFEEILEENFYNLSNNLLLNILFIFLFWFAVATAVGFVLKKAGFLSFAPNRGKQT